MASSNGKRTMGQEVKVIQEMIAYSLEDVDKFWDLTDREQKIVGDERMFKFLKKWVVTKLPK